MKNLSLLEKLRHAIAGGSTPSALEDWHPGGAKPGGRGAAGTGGEVELVLGIDLGTSCTKVVIGDRSLRNTAWVVPAAVPAPGIGVYLHPTKVGSESNLKMRLMDQPGDTRLQALLAECLAGVIRRAWDWFTENAPAAYAGRRLRWVINVGYPRKSLEDSALKNAYTRIAADAVQRALCAGGGPGLDAATGGAIEMELYPEIGAQLAGYVRSPYRKSGNLLLVDIGAGTLDVSTLILGKADMEDLVSFQVCRVEELGALRLLQKRMESVEVVRPGCVGRGLGEFQEGAAALPEALEGLVYRPSLPLRKAFSAATHAFGERVLETVVGCVAGFRKRLRACHHTRGFDPIGGNLRMMVTGGGSRSGFYRNLLSGVLEAELVRYTRWEENAVRRAAAGQGISPESLPVPRDLQNLPPDLHAEFDRLSVAYGLALGGRNLMRVLCAPDGEAESFSVRGDVEPEPRIARAA
jgi:hypothetical protein